MSRFTFILNPNAGKGTGRRVRNKIAEVLKTHFSDFDFLETSGPGEATEIARMSSSPTIVAIGGDGTAHEAANGILGSEKVLGVIPIGSGNDFIKSIGVPKDLLQSVTTLCDRNIRSIDVGRVEINSTEQSRHESSSSVSFFVNGLGIGFDAAVADKARRMSYVSGTLLYLISVLQTIGKYRSPDYSFSIDGNATISKNLLIAVGNGICAGGGFYLTPRAKVDDGLLDICFIEESSVLDILRMIPSVMKGKHLGLPGVRVESGHTITMSASAPISVHSDGEILGTNITGLEIAVVPRALSVIVGWQV